MVKMKNLKIHLFFQDIKNNKIIVVDIKCLQQCYYFKYQFTAINYNY